MAAPGTMPSESEGAATGDAAAPQYGTTHGDGAAPDSRARDADGSYRHHIYNEGLYTPQDPTRCPTDDDLPGIWNFTSHWPQQGGTALFGMAAVLRDIYRNQHPANCSEAKFLTHYPQARSSESPQCVINNTLSMPWAPEHTFVEWTAGDLSDMPYGPERAFF